MCLNPSKCTRRCQCTNTGTDPGWLYCCVATAVGTSYCSTPLVITCSASEQEVPGVGASAAVSGEPGKGKLPSKALAAPVGKADGNGTAAAAAAGKAKAGVGLWGGSVDESGMSIFKHSWLNKAGTVQEMCVALSWGDYWIGGQPCCDCDH